MTLREALAVVFIEGWILKGSRTRLNEPGDKWLVLNVANQMIGCKPTIEEAVAEAVADGGKIL